MPRKNTPRKTQTPSLLNGLYKAKHTLRFLLIPKDLDPTTRAHIERAMSHIEEAYSSEAFAELRNRRTVDQFVLDLKGLAHLFEKEAGK